MDGAKAVEVEQHGSFLVAPRGCRVRSINFD